MNHHALTVLQYPEALAVIARHAAHPLGAEAVRALEPTAARAWVEEELGRVDEMMTFILRNEEWAVPVLPDLRGPLGRLATEGSVWKAAELRDAGRLLESSRATRRAILRFSQDYPRMAAIAERCAKLEAEAKRLRHAITEDGEVADRASKELSRLRREIRDERSSIVQRLERFIAGLPEKTRVADASVTLRGGRYVVPIRRAGRSKVGGIVHDESSTGQTLFVEPPVAIEWVNRLRELERREQREVRRILSELTDVLRPHRDEIVQTLEALTALDSLYARGRYALGVNGHRPEILPDGERGYEVVTGKHPLLLAAAQDHVVPFDLRLDPDERTLLVSGPNTGGKTVLLKAIGLISAMAQAGIIPPVGPNTRIPLFDEFFADIGDEQSIEASLSTFSAHLKNLREVLERADAGALVLIDEIGSGTDPAEGGALARSILVELTRRGTMTVATSHLGQLKLLAGEREGVVNASLQFDARELEPTYRLVKGVPGRSYGLAIARRLGFPRDVLERAEESQPREQREVGQLLRDIEEKEQGLAEELDAARVARKRARGTREELERREDALERREEALRRREKDEERRARQQARDLLMNARESVEEAIRDLRESVGGAGADALEEHAQRARRAVESAAGRQAERAPERERDRGPAPVPEDVRPGARVRVEATGALGRVVELRDGRATVETRGLKMQVAAAELTVVEESDEGGSESRGARASSSPASAGWSGPAADASPEVHLRGMRVDEARAALLPALDAAVQAGLRELRIIHGKGTGVLRELVSEMLADDGRVRSFRAGRVGEGGTGVTVAELE